MHSPMQVVQPFEREAAHKGSTQTLQQLLLQGQLVGRVEAAAWLASPQPQHTASATKLGTRRAVTFP